MCDRAAPVEAVAVAASPPPRRQDTSGDEDRGGEEGGQERANPSARRRLRTGCISRPGHRMMPAGGTPGHVEIASIDHFQDEEEVRRHARNDLAVPPGRNRRRGVSGGDPRGGHSAVAHRRHAPRRRVYCRRGDGAGPALRLRRDDAFAEAARARRLASPNGSTSPASLVDSRRRRPAVHLPLRPISTKRSLGVLPGCHGVIAEPGGMMVSLVAAGRRGARRPRRHGLSAQGLSPTTCEQWHRRRCSRTASPLGRRPAPNCRP